MTPDDQTGSAYTRQREGGRPESPPEPEGIFRARPARFELATSRSGSARSQAHTANGGGESTAPALRRRRSLATHRPKPGEILPARPRQRKGAAS